MAGLVLVVTPLIALMTDQLNKLPDFIPGAALNSQQSFDLKKKVVQAAQYDSSRITNLDLLQKLGFNKTLIAENRRLGLKERDMTSDF